VRGPKLPIAGLFLLLLPAVHAETVPVCVVESARLGEPALKAFHEEFHRLMATSEVRLTREPCAAQPAIELTIRQTPPARYRTALGLAFRRGGQVLPQLELYVTPVVRLLDGQQTAGIVGRALARVAAHETLHFLRQQSHHDRDGLMKAVFRPADLTAASPGVVRD